MSDSPAEEFFAPVRAGLEAFREGLDKRENRKIAKEEAEKKALRQELEDKINQRKLEISEAELADRQRRTDIMSRKAAQGPRVPFREQMQRQFMKDYLEFAQDPNKTPEQAELFKQREAALMRLGVLKEADEANYDSLADGIYNLKELTTLQDQDLKAIGTKLYGLNAEAYSKVYNDMGLSKEQIQKQLQHQTAKQLERIGLGQEGAFFDVNDPLVLDKVFLESSYGSEDQFIRMTDDALKIREAFSKMSPEQIAKNLKSDAFKQQSNYLKKVAADAYQESLQKKLIKDFAATKGVELGVLKPLVDITSKAAIKVIELNERYKAISPYSEALGAAKERLRQGAGNQTKEQTGQSIAQSLRSQGKKVNLRNLIDEDQLLDAQDEELNKDLEELDQEQ